MLPRTADQILVSMGHETVSNTIIEQLKELIVLHLAKRAVGAFKNAQNGT